MNNPSGTPEPSISDTQLEQFKLLMLSMVQCCNERSQYQCERFGLTDAEFRCLQLFSRERYLTPGGMAQAMNVVKSRITRIVSGLKKKGLIRQSPAPEDSRVSLLSLTHDGRERLDDIEDFLQATHQAVLERLTPQQRRDLIASLGSLKLSMEAVRDMLV